MKKILLVLALLLFALGIYFYPKYSSEFRIATGFSAKNICSGYFISGFSPETIMTEGLIPLSPFFEKVSFEIDSKKRSVTSKIFSGFSSEAIFKPGLGCQITTNRGNDPYQELTEYVPFKHPKENNSESWPDGLGEKELSAKTDSKSLNLAIRESFREPTSQQHRNTKAVVVIHKGKLIAESYSPGVSKTTPLLSWSMAKSVTGLLVGLLVKDEVISIDEQSVVSEWSDEKDPRNNISIDQLLRMSSGLAFKEIYGLGSDAAKMLSVEPSAGVFAINKPLVHQPNVHWAYSSGTTNILSEIMRRKFEDDQAYYDFPQQRLFKPLGISSAVIEPDPTGTFIGSSYMYASARDWAKLGQLVLQKGNWNGHQLLPKFWIDYVCNATGPDPSNSYGAHFWLNKKPSKLLAQKGTTSRWPNVPEDACMMSGFQGQLVVSIPSLELVVVRLGYTKPGTDKGIEALLEGVIGSIR